MSDVSLLNRDVHAEFERGLSVMRASSGQIRSLVRDSVIKLDNSFNGLRRQSEQQRGLVMGLAADLDEQGSGGDKQTPDAVSRGGGKAETANIEGFVQSTNTILQFFVDRTVQISQESMRMVYRMDEVAVYMHQVHEHIGKINTVVELTKGLALNARIVAARAGRSGESFNFVATEIHQLASSSRQASDQISDVVEETNSNIHSVRDILKEIASKDMGIAMGAREQVESMTTEITALNTHRAKTLRHVSSITGEIGKNVDLALAILQFEKNVNQILGRIDRKLALLEQFSRLVDWEFLMNDDLPLQERLDKVRRALSQQQQAFDAVG